MTITANGGAFERQVRTLNLKPIGQRTGSGRGSVGRAVPSDTRDPRFKSQHWQSFIYQLSLNRKDENEEKEAGNGPSLK